MYHVTGTLITVSILYLLSFMLYRTGIYSQVLHRRIWNTILAGTFIFTALAGIFMALQIRFKWNIPFIDELLKWHVEIGVTLGITGLFHFIWHLPYYAGLFKKTQIDETFAAGIKPDHPSLSENLFMVGFTGTSLQILLMRELINITGGYELITGIFLGSWLVASSAGAALAGRSPLNDLRRINSLFIIGAFISTALLILLARLFLETGEVPTFLGGIILTFIMLIPFCLINGYTFVKLINNARESGLFTPGRSFSIETTGGIVSGIVLTILTSGFLKTYKLLLIILFLFLAYIILAWYAKKNKHKIIARIFFSIMISALVIAEPDLFFRKLLLPAVNIFKTADTPYGNISSGNYGGETSIYYNQRLISSTNDVIEREEDIHYAMLQVDKPEKVLLISGSLKSHLPEIMKYDVSQVVYVERDPGIVKELTDKETSAIKELKIENVDAYRYLKDNDEKFDAVIMLLPPPSTLAINRFYTTGFFVDVKRSLSSKGVFICSPGPNDNYLNDEAVTLYSSIYGSLKTVFSHVEPIPGNKLYLAASDNELSVSFAGLPEVKNIDNSYVNSSFISDDIFEKRSSEIKSLIDKETRLNTAAFPVACFHFQSYNISRKGDEKIPAIILLIAAFIFPVAAVRRKNMLMYFSAAALAGFEIIVLLMLQLTAGNIYQLAGLVIAVMMAGLAAGAGLENNLFQKTGLRVKSLIIIIYYISIALLFNLILRMNGTIVAVVLIILSVIPPAFMTGHVFRILSLSAAEPSGPGMTYSADLAGSALGFILVTGIAVPAFGIRNSVVMLSVMVLAGVIFGKRDS